MAYNPMMGLLADQQSLAPNLGLLGRIGNPEQDPIKAALAQMAGNRPQMAPGAPAPISGPFAPPQPLSGQGGPVPQGGQPPQGPPPPPPAPPTRRPLVTPTQMALLSAGQELSREDAPTLAHAVSRALAAGVPAFLTSKQAERDREDAAALEADWQQTIHNLPGTITAAQRALLRTAGRTAGSKMLESILAEQQKQEAPYTLGKDDTRFGAGNTPVAEGVRSPEPAPPATATADIKNFLGTFAPAAGLGMTPENYVEWPEAAKQAFAKFQEANQPKGTSVSVTVPMGAQRFAETTAGNAADILTADYNKVRAGETALVSLERIESLMQQPNFLGAYADQKTGLSKAANSLLGLNVGLDKAQATESIRAHVENVVIPRLEEMGTRPSDEDLKALRRTIGETTYNPATLAEIVRLQRNIITKRASDYNQDWLATYDQFKELGASMPANLRPVGPRADQIREWAALSPDERRDLVRSGVPDPTKFTPLPANLIPGGR